MHSDRFDRREMLRIGSLAIGGLTLPQMFAARAATPMPRRDTSVIMLYLHGGPSHLETYDIKPSAPEGYRSVFKPIPTNVPGIDICEHFPRQAKIADKFAIVRSLNHDVNIHSDGGIVVLTGKRPTVLDPSSTSKSEHPDFGSIASHIRGYGPDPVPPYVMIPVSPYMTRPTYLGLHNAGFAVGDPSTPNYRPPQLTLNSRDIAGLDDRRRLLHELDRVRASLNPGDRFREQAFDLLTSRKVGEAFDLTRESEKVRDRYGRNIWGQGCLLARRLATAGVAVINLYINTPQNGPDFTNWDDHIQNAGRPGHFAGFMKTRLPYLDECLSALIEDVYDRGLDRNIMIVVVGEFGRTPRLSTNANGTGRDHWPQAYSALISGGGLRVGQVVGATNSRGEHPAARPYSPQAYSALISGGGLRVGQVVGATNSRGEHPAARPYSPQDLLATMYRHLGIDPSQPLMDATGRPTPILADGTPIPELMG